MWTADEDVNMKVIFAVMNSTWAVVIIRPEKEILARTVFEHVWICSRLEYFFKAYYHYCSSTAHYCEDHFHIHILIGLQVLIIIWFFYCRFGEWSITPQAPRLSLSLTTSPLLFITALCDLLINFVFSCNM